MKIVGLESLCGSSIKKWNQYICYSVDTGDLIKNKTFEPFTFCSIFFLTKKMYFQVTLYLKSVI